MQELVVLDVNCISNWLILVNFIKFGVLLTNNFVYLANG